MSFLRMHGYVDTGNPERGRGYRGRQMQPGGGEGAVSICMPGKVLSYIQPIHLPIVGHGPEPDVPDDPK